MAIRAVLIVVVSARGDRGVARGVDRVGGSRTVKPACTILGAGYGIPFLLATPNGGIAQKADIYQLLDLLSTGVYKNHKSRYNLAHDFT